MCSGWLDGCFLAKALLFLLSEMLSSKRRDPRRITQKLGRTRTRIHALMDMEIHGAYVRVGRAAVDAMMRVHVRGAKFVIVHALWL